MSDQLLRRILAIGILVFGLMMAASILSHNPMDPSPFHVSTLQHETSNLVGRVGAVLSALLLGVFGMAALLLPLIFVTFGIRMIRNRAPEKLWWHAGGWLLVMLSLPGLIALLCRDLPYRGGVLDCGGLLGSAARDLLGGLAGPVGRFLVLIFTMIVGILIILEFSLEDGAEGLTRGLKERLAKRREMKLMQRRSRQKEEGKRKVLEKHLPQLDSGDSQVDSIFVKEVEGRGSFRINRKAISSAESGGPDISTESEAVSPKPRTSSARRKNAKPEKETAPTPPIVQEEFDFIDDLDSYDLPRLNFLEPSDAEVERDSSLLMEIGALLTQKCQEFRVRGEVVGIRTGPVITTYEFKLASGVKIAAVQNLSEDLALALKTPSVRIERIPGRATIGIEVPNPQPEIIRLSQLIDTPEFQRARSLLSLCMGVDIRGKPFVADLQRMPHLLIGGFTGSGKSVGINAMILSILYRAKPDEVKFIFVDPKMVELGVYRDIPHLLTPIITEPKKAANALAWAVDEMDTRYRRLAMLGVRNIEQYNQLVAQPDRLVRTIDQFLGGEAGPDDFQALPYIVIVIDELADLMMTSGREVEEAITRIAQKARAVGLHLICATQRPSVDVLTGIIKANFPCRVAYKVRSRHDSRTILDSMGAEHLIGRGDMLYLPPGTSNILRLHGPLVTEKEIASVVSYIKRFAKPDYQKEILKYQPVASRKNSGGGGSGDSTGQEEYEDPMYAEAVRIVVQERKASASHLQRRLRLGYTRAARLVDTMEAEGIVGSPAGSKGREVLVAENYLSEVDETLALNGPEETEKGHG